MAATSSWNRVRLYGTWRSLDGSLKAGQYKISVSGRVTNHTDDVIYPSGVFASAPLQTSVADVPSLDVMVPATDDPDNDQGNWKLQVEVTFTDGGASEKYQLDIPVADRPVADGGTGKGVNLRTIALAAQLPQSVALYKVGVPGGLATLNANGDVVDSDGNVVLGGGGGAVDSVNGKTGAVSLTASDVAAVPTTRTINGKPLSANVVLAAGDVGAAPTTRTVNGKALSADVTLNASDVGAQPSGSYATTAQLPGAATTTTTGTVELATNAETTTGTDTTRAVTPAGVAAVAATRQAVDSNGALTRFLGFLTQNPASPVAGDYWYLVG